MEVEEDEGDNEHFSLGFGMSVLIRLDFFGIGWGNLSRSRCASTEIWNRGGTLYIGKDGK
jgi:hypothetical protein